jgi:hypothetical protein
VIVLADGRKLLTLRGRAENARMLVLCGATHSSCEPWMSDDKAPFIRQPRIWAKGKGL